MKMYFPFLVAACIALLVLAAGCAGTQTAAHTTSIPAVIRITETSRTVSTPVVTTEKTSVPAMVPTTSKALKPTPATMPRITVPEGSIAKYYTYTLNGKSDIIAIALPTSVYEDYTRKTPSYNNGNEAYFLAFMNDREQQPYIAALAKAIREKTSVTDDQARIAVSLVQHIPYHDDPKQYRYPYEVMYSGEGVCGEKSMLLAALLRELGYGSAVFYFVKEDHMTAGISVPSPYGYRGTMYAFIESTEPNIITYDGTVFSFGSLSSMPQVIPVGTGTSLSSIASDHEDSLTFTAIEENIHHLTAAESAGLDALDTKYDLDYYTCQNCRIPKVA
nr:transglutaminase domain-containing protein [uncultured Methanoregula sp.]